MRNYSKLSLRTVRAEDRFTEQLESLGIDIGHWDEVFSNGLEFVLARNPESFHQLKGSPLRVATVECYRDLPLLKVLFVFDHDHVYLLDIYLGEGIEDE